MTLNLVTLSPGNGAGTPVLMSLTPEQFATIRDQKRTNLSLFLMRGKIQRRLDDTRDSFTDDQRRTIEGPGGGREDC